MYGEKVVDSFSHYYGQDNEEVAGLFLRYGEDNKKVPASSSGMERIVWRFRPHSQVWRG